MTADRGEPSRHRMAEHSPAVADRAQPVGGSEPVTGSELVEQPE
jgi:hypothetical protein